MQANNVKRIAVVLLKLPDGRIVLQRRTKDASHAPGKLGLFGGHVEPKETAIESIVRELTEETSINVQSADIQPVANFIVPAGIGYSANRHFYLYEMQVPSINFDVHEGDGAEAYPVAELKERSDVAKSVKFIINRVLE